MLDKKFVVLGHRGAPKYFRENTITSFREAINQGVDGIELDVQKQIFKSLLDNNQLYITYEEQDDPRFDLDKHDISLTNLFYVKN